MDGLKSGLAVVVSGLVTHGGAAQPDYDFQWAVIGDRNNPAYEGGPWWGNNKGRGSVPYKYRISRLETTTAQWLEFVNTYSTQSDDLKWFAAPLWWGADHDPDYDGPGQRWVLRDIPDAERVPVRGISWRDAAMFCNWLHNGKGDSLDAIADGAYDTSTFGQDPDNPNYFTDQLHHSPDALFWIPTLDEWLKAAHFDPDRYGPGAPGWWEYSHSSDTAPSPGIPGEGQTSGSLQLPDFAETDIPLGAYTNVQSPWGLWDTSGATAEWLEETDWEHPSSRGADGNYAGSSEFAAELDLAYVTNYLNPTFTSYMGLRVVSVTPSPGTGLVAVFWSIGVFGASHRRRAAS